MEHIKTYNSFINEKAIPFDEILKAETQQGIVIKDVPGKSTTRAIVLYDFDDKKILAYAQIRKWNKSDTVWEIDQTAAEKDYGPDLYDLALMSVYPEMLKPSATIKPAAQKVWKYYTEKRPDVKRTPVPEDDDDYAVRFETEEDGKEAYSTEKTMLDVINTRYSLEPTDVFKQLVERGKEYMEKYKIDTAKIVKLGNAYFWKRYN